MTDRIAHIREAAKGLLAQASDSDERVQIRADNGSVLPIYIGRSFPSGSFNAVVRLVKPSDLPPNYKRPEIQGISIVFTDVKRRAGGPFDIVMELLHPEAVDVFIVFIARLCEIVEKCGDSKTAVHKALGELELWKHFFAGVASQALSEGRQTGLFGELTMLHTLIQDGLSVAAGVKAWTGASATNQDFEFRRAAIEVKSTTSADAMEVAVSNIRQLDTTGLDRLYLAKFAFDVRRGDASTLVTIIEELREQVALQAGHLRAAFEQKLIGAGYRDEHAEEYGNRSYTLRDLSFYKVQGGFPRLEESALPAGVGNVRYSVNLHGCAQYKEDSSGAIQEVIKASD